jgi:hypothetical protein
MGNYKSKGGERPNKLVMRICRDIQKRADLKPALFCSVFPD